MTRPRADAERTARRLRGLGHDAVVSPVMAITACRPRPDIAALAPPDLVLVTSVNALRVLADHPDRHLLLERPLLAVGRRTATVARRQGFRHVDAAEGDAVSLIEQAKAKLPKGGRALHLAGRDRAADLAAALAPSGIDVDLAVLYEAQSIPHLTERADKLLRAGALHAILHFSTRSAALFLAQLQGDVNLVEKAALLSHLCLSSKVATALKPLGAKTVLIAQRPEERALIDLLPRLGSPSGE
ncbi:uroporphyrinogen-III synthase [Agaricicola taiwanensis]|uniref:uroporphyrinogen-III synthase n=1 Tax=Agaricicola taiwanensis TaxID=591372 RepID=UPI00166E5870|nr:uroporphyrinogen-III synthase [Agaricicola taiwanensis]